MGDEHGVWAMGSVRRRRRIYMSTENPIYVCRCVKCNHSFTEAEVEGASACPYCGSRGLPMDPTKDVTITVNVHELRILGIWAENYAVSQDNKHLDDAHYEAMKDTVNVIMERIEEQLRIAGKHAPLTLSRELSELKQAFPKSDVEFYRNGHEEIVE